MDYLMSVKRKLVLKNMKSHIFNQVGPDFCFILYDYCAPSRSSHWGVSSAEVYAGVKEATRLTSTSLSSLGSQPHLRGSCELNCYF